MRLVSILAFSVVFALGLGAAAQTPLIGQQNVAFTGGVYTSLTAPSALGCAQLCAQDTICMAWTFRPAGEGSCELKAVVPHAVTERGAISGTSSRAPAFARGLATPAPANLIVAASETPMAPPPAEFAPPASSPDTSSDLLGGPAPDPDLRPRLAEQAGQ